MVTHRTDFYFINIQEMTDDIIIEQLKNRELQLVDELNKVRLALRAFINESILPNEGRFVYPEMNVPAGYETTLTYCGKILYVLSKSEAPLLVEEITEALHKLEPGLDQVKLQKSVSHNVSMLAKYARVKRHPFNRKIKYSLR
jgi:hypothetical protein